MPNPWFETVAEAQRRAKKRLPAPVYGALIAGSERGLSYKDNLAAFGELAFAPKVAGHQAERRLSTTVLGLDIGMPVIISPTGVQAVHPDGEVAVARAAANRGIPIGLSSFASKSVEEVAAVGGRMVLSNAFHLYLRPGDHMVRALGGLHAFTRWDGPACWTLKMISATS